MSRIVDDLGQFLNEWVLNTPFTETVTKICNPNTVKIQFFFLKKIDICRNIFRKNIDFFQENFCIFSVFFVFFLKNRKNRKNTKIFLKKIDIFSKNISTNIEFFQEKKLYFYCIRITYEGGCLVTVSVNGVLKYEP